ncbi:hypothetical protein [Bacteroides ihuae]|uniref:hypothetical protein n=1 Tax=Bacteroides ihuae TaxID=1852362 RepID=UPI0008D99CB4|nr:hypothetical protein [Bacteroides ihuae]
MDILKRLECTPLRFLVLIFLTLLFRDTEMLSQTMNKVLSEKSSFEVIDQNGMKGYKSVEYTYKVYGNTVGDKWVDYLAKYKTTTIKDLSYEGQNRTIEVAICRLDRMDSIIYYIKQDCDQLDLSRDNYKTIKYGCCADLTKVALYDYNNRVIISGSEKIYEGFIPNNKIRFYFSYQSHPDTLTLGQINYSYNASDQYHVVLKSKRSTTRSAVENCPMLYPEIDLSFSGAGRFDKDEEACPFWSLEKIKTINEINFILKLKFDCDSTIRPITIPIINGKPFGKDIETQIYNIEYD